MTSFVLRREVLLGFMVLAACGQASGDDRPRGESPLLSEKEEARPPDPNQVKDDADELVRAVLLRRRDGAKKLGAHEFHGQHKLRVYENGKEIEALDETTTIEQTATGDLHARYTNSRSYGREIFSAKGTVWLRPRWGKFHKRAPATVDEPDRVADEIFGTLAADLELVGFSMKSQDGGEALVAGRKGRRFKLALGSPRKKPAETQDARKWRDSVSVQNLDGEVVLDQETGALLSGRLTTRVAFQREGRALEMALEATHAVDKVGGAVAVTPPPDDGSVTTPLRSKEFEERQELLEGVAPPAAKAPVPGEEAR